MKFDPYTILFYFFALFIIGSAVVVVLSRNILHAAFALLFTFFGVACIYIMLNADFIAAAQVLIYVGGVLILILFGVMLTQRIGDVKFIAIPMQLYGAGIVCILIFSFIVYVIHDQQWVLRDKQITSTTQRIGTILLNEYLLPFEIASLLLVVALVGAAIIAERAKRRW
uniref:NADH dehydrogenase I subunit J n=1 Tax=uncultured prokaryote TaxID=198431 RepID=H5SP94_9ZZZZ|nr:NADH dehydrogenase I subunit J [uncultured prokaryote]